MNYSKLNIDLLMNIIENRQKVFLQRLEFHADFKATFPIGDVVVDDSGEHGDGKEEG